MILLICYSPKAFSCFDTTFSSVNLLLQDIELCFSDESKLSGRMIGHQASFSGELVINTAQSGYFQVISDPSYYTQIVAFTQPHIGNYGINQEPLESSQFHAKAIICEQFYVESSRQMNYFLEKEIPIIDQVNVRHLAAKLNTVSSLVEVRNPMANQSLEPTDFPSYERDKGWKRRIFGKGNEHKLLLIDFGVKRTIIEDLVFQDFQVECLPFIAINSIEDVSKYDGVILSNGPFHPTDYEMCVPKIQQLIQRGIPILGICLGMQLLLLAEGAQFLELPKGHRGVNYPVIDKLTNHCYITNQNHSYSVMPDTIPNNYAKRFVNLIDDSVEGVMHTSQPILAVQFHPEGRTGTHDTKFLFDEFKQLCS